MSTSILYHMFGVVGVQYKSFNLKKLRHIAIDDEYLKLRIFNLHNSIYALTG